jgi:serine/threonine protein kinase
MFLARAAAARMARGLLEADAAPGATQVDVWAAGVVVYQMLFGRRPFGEGRSQEAILREEVILNARAVAFPAKPAVSADARDFITRRAPACLAPARPHAGSAPRPRPLVAWRAALQAQLPAREEGGATARRGARVCDRASGGGSICAQARRAAQRRPAAVPHSWPRRVTQLCMVCPRGVARGAKQRAALRRCLAYRQQDRLSVAAAAAHPFLQLRRGRRRSAAAAAAAPAAAGRAGTPPDGDEAGAAAAPGGSPDVARLD